MLRGFEHATMDEIADHCSISKRTLYSNFIGKAALFVTVLSQVEGPVLCLQQSGGYPDLTSSLISLFRLGEQDRGKQLHWWFLRDAIGQARYSPEVDGLLGANSHGSVRTTLYQWFTDEARMRGLSVSHTETITDLLVNVGFPVTKRNLSLTDVSEIDIGDAVIQLVNAMAIVGKGIVASTDKNLSSGRIY